MSSGSSKWNARGTRASSTTTTGGQDMPAAPNRPRPLTSSLVHKLFAPTTPQPHDVDDVVLLRACLDSAETTSLQTWAQELHLPTTLSRPRLKTLLLRSSWSGHDLVDKLSDDEYARVLTRLPQLPPRPVPVRDHIQTRLQHTQVPSTTTAQAQENALPKSCPSFVALDFETANARRESACALAAIRVDGGRITAKVETLIRPSWLYVESWHRQLHGLTADDLADAPPFAQVYPRLLALLSGASFIVAHNAGFDRSVLEACCREAKLAPPLLPYLCTVQLARKTFDLPSYKLNIVAAHLRIPLRHHDASSDAEASARIALEVHRRRPELFWSEDEQRVQQQVWTRSRS